MEQSNEELEVVKVDDEVDINEEKIRDDRVGETKTATDETTTIMNKVSFLTLHTPTFLSHFHYP